MFGHTQASVALFDVPTHPLRAFRQQLIDVPVRVLHAPEDLINIFVRNVDVEKIAHGINEDSPRLLPGCRPVEHFPPERQIEAALEVVTLDTTEPLRELHGVAVVASR